MGFWGTLFGSSKALEETAKFGNNIVEKAGSFIDNLHYSEQEKDASKMDIIKGNMNMTILMNKFNDQGKSLSRRVIAFAFVGSYLIPLWVSKILLCFDITEQATILSSMSDKLDSHIKFIFYFYFGYYGITSIIGKFKKNK